LTIEVVLLFCLVLNTNYEIIPLRFLFSIDLLGQYKYFSLINLIEDVESNLTREQMLEYMSLSLSNNEINLCERDF